MNIFNTTQSEDISQSDKPARKILIKLKETLDDITYFFKGFSLPRIWTAYSLIILEDIETVKSIIDSILEGDEQKIGALLEHTLSLHNKAGEEEAARINTLSGQSWEKWKRSWDFNKDVYKVIANGEGLDKLHEVLKLMLKVAKKDLDNIAVPTYAITNHELYLKSLKHYSISSQALEKKDYDLAFASLSEAISLHNKGETFHDFDGSAAEIKKMENNVAGIKEASADFNKREYPLTQEDQEVILNSINEDTRKEVLALGENLKQKMLKALKYQMDINSVYRTKMLMEELNFDTAALKEILSRKETQLNTFPNSSILHSLLALLYFKLEIIDLAENAFRKSLTIDPNDIETLYSYGQFLHKQGKYREAISVLEAAEESCRTKREKTKLYPFVRKELSSTRIDSGTAKARREQERDSRRRYHWWY